MGAEDDAAYETARRLAGEGRFAEAGRLLLRGLGAEAAKLGALDPAKQRSALMAAIYLARGGETQSAVDLFLALGERRRAIEALEQAGDYVGAALLQRQEPVAAPAVPAATPASAPTLQTARRLEAAGHYDLALKMFVQLGRFGEAARLARQLGRNAAAAELYLSAQMPFEAATCFFEAGDRPRALESFLRVRPEDRRYRVGCVEAVGLAADLGTLSLELEQFLTGFIRSGPRDDAEMEAFHRLGTLYRSQGFIENAREAFAKLLAARPDYRDAAAQLASLETKMGMDTGALPSLPEPPPLPPLPPPPAPPAAREAEAERAAERGPIFDVGAKIGGRYRLNGKIGHGGTSVVFRATDLDLGEEIALKVFTQAVYEEETDGRFKRELRLSRQLIHPNILRLYDIGLYYGFRYISMELLEGSDLLVRMSSGDPIPIAEGLDYVTQACAGLQAAHDQGVVHRDIKPGNFFLTTKGVLKIMDFGIAKMQSAPGLTATGVIAGTPAYMSPEQINNFSGVSHTTDLYAMGVVMYEMFTGTLPFKHPDAMAVLMMHLNDPPAPPRKHNRALPLELEEVILKLLRKKPELRFASCRELGQALEAIRRRLGG